MAEFAELIRKKRTEKGLTQLELARLAGVEGPYISQIEKGEKVPSIGVAGRLAVALELPREAVINLALKEKAPDEAKVFFSEAGPKYPELRELILSRCRNREELEPELKRAPFSRFEEWLLRLMVWGLAKERDEPRAEGWVRALESGGRELVSFIAQNLEGFQFDFNTWGIEVKPVGAPPFQIKAVERPWESAGAISGVSVTREAEGFQPLAAVSDKESRIPVVGLVEAGKGGFYDDQGYPVGQGMYTVSRPYDLKDTNAYGVEVSGDSMVPRLYDRDVVIASPAKAVLSGDLAVVRFSDDEVVIKRVRFKDDLVILESVNPAYEPRILSRHEIKFMHRVVWIKPR